MMNARTNTIKLGAGLAVLLAAGPAMAEPEGGALFRQQCSACHSVTAGDPPRQGPNLAGVYGRKAGSAAGFGYSPGFATAGFSWDDTHLDAYLTDPQSVIPGAVMPYKQKKPEIRQAIIAWLKEQH